MANQEHVKVVSQGPEALRQWREKHPDLRLDLKGADLAGLDLSSARLREADLRGASLVGAKLSRASLAD